MATPAAKLASSLEALSTLQDGGRRVFKSSEFGRTNRERLVANGFLQPVIKGWLISSSPGSRPGDTTPWFASFWDFCFTYCEDRMGSEWHLSPSQSLLLHAEATGIPDQVIIYSPLGRNHTTSLPFDTSMYDLKSSMPPAEDVTVLDGLRMLTPSAALGRVPEDFFRRYPVEAQVILGGIKDASDVLRDLLDGGKGVVAGRLAGAFRRIGKSDFADEIIATMKAVGHTVRESDPFVAEQTIGRIRAYKAPIVARIEGLWESMRDEVIAAMPAAPGIPSTPDQYLEFVDDIYQSDAYHSLSIEGYRVTAELIERVRAGAWNAERNEDDRRNRDALAARGYWQAFQKVKHAVAEALSGGNPGEIARAHHREWYRELFQPSVAAGLTPASALAGYRTDAVYLRGSRHVPPRWEAIRDAMPALMDVLAKESEPSARAVLGHWMFGYIHPYPDGNGRTARFLMNVMLASGGYPWTVIRVEDRDTYMSTLESASSRSDIRPFALFISERLQWSIEQMDRHPSKHAHP